MPDVITASEYLKVNSYPFATPAARIQSLYPLWSMEDRGGSDLALRPGVNRAYARFTLPTQYVFRGVVWGDKDRTGAVHSNVRVGLDTNIEAIHTALAIPATDRGTLAAIWHKASGADWTADVHVEAFTITDLSPRAASFTLALTIPAGRFVAPPPP